MSLYYACQILQKKLKFFGKQKKSWNLLSSIFWWFVAHHPVAKGAEVLSRTLKAVADDPALAPDKLVEAAHEAHDHEHDHGTELHSWIGVALVLGFVFMLLVDQIGGSIHSRTSGGQANTLNMVIIISYEALWVQLLVVCFVIMTGSETEVI